MNNALENLRKAMRNRARDSNIATVARDIGVSANALDAFVYNDAELPEPAVHQLTEYAFSGLMKLDPATDTLTTVPGPEPAPMMTAPLPVEPAKKRDLTKDERIMPGNALKLERGPQWDPKLDKLWRHRPESRGPLG